MSKINDVIGLVKAGFTKEEIIEMFKAPLESEKVETPVVEEIAKPVVDAIPETPKSDDMAKVISALDNLTKAVHANNLMNTEIKPNVDTSIDVFAKILGGEVPNGK